MGRSQQLPRRTVASAGHSAESTRKHRPDERSGGAGDFPGFDAKLRNVIRILPTWADGLGLECPFRCPKPLKPPVRFEELQLSMKVKRDGP